MSKKQNRKLTSVSLPLTIVDRLERVRVEKASTSTLPLLLEAAVEFYLAHAERPDERLNGNWFPRLPLCPSCHGKKRKWFLPPSGEPGEIVSFSAYVQAREDKEERADPVS